MEALRRVSNEPLVRRYLWDHEPVSRVEIEELVAQSTRMFLEEGLGLFGVRLRGGEELVGFCGFLRLEGMEEPELAYELLPQVWGRGLATEAARACVRHAFEAVGLERVIAGADAPNVASLRVMEKLGMKPIGSINPHLPEDPYYALYRKGYFVSGAATVLARTREGAIIVTESDKERMPAPRSKVRPTKSDEQIVRANGVDLCVQTFGDRTDPAILLVAGTACSMDWWEDEFCELLAAGSRFVIRYDHRDTGRSVSYEPGAPPYT
ncbi:MAG: GNAT family N-acetyltransferase, partial [Rubrobacter sp.]